MIIEPRQTDKLLWQMEMRRARTPKPVKRTLSLNHTLRSITELALQNLGGQVGISEASADLIQEHTEAFARQMAMRENNPNLVYALMHLFKDRRYEPSEIYIPCRQTVNVIDTPSPDRVAQSEIDHLFTLKQRFNDHSSGLYHIINEDGDIAGKMICLRANSDEPHQIHFANRNGDWIQMDFPSSVLFFSLWRSEEILAMAMALFQVESQSLDSAIKEMEEICVYDIEPGRLYCLSDSHNPFLTTHIPEAFLENTALLTGIAHTLQTEVDMTDEEMEEFFVARHIQLNNQTEVKGYDTESTIWWSLTEDIFRDSKIYSLSDRDDRGEFLFSGYQTRTENRRFFEDLKRRASDIDDIEFVKGDFNSLPSTSFGIRDIEQIKDGAVERQYTGVIYIYAKKDELPVPAGYAVVAMTAGYQRPTIEELPRHPITGILLSGEVVSIYLAPEFRGQGGASFIGEAINSVYGHDLLRSIDQFYSNLLETPPPVELSFSADTISSGGMSVMDALDDELEMLRDMFLETSALEDISVSVAYS